MITRAGPSRIISLFAFQIDVLYYPIHCPFLLGVVTSELSVIIPCHHVTATSELLLITGGRGRPVSLTLAHKCPGPPQKQLLFKYSNSEGCGPR